MIYIVEYVRYQFIDSLNEKEEDYCDGTATNGRL